MAANGSGLQLATIRNIATAWVLTLPAAMLISTSLYWMFSHLFYRTVAIAMTIVFQFPRAEVYQPATTAAPDPEICGPNDIAASVTRNFSLSSHAFRESVGWGLRP